MNGRQGSPAVSEFVLDASAVIGVLRNEPGADYVVERGRGALISSVNVAEVIFHPDVAHANLERVEALFRAMHLREVPFDRQQAETLALIHPRTLGSSVGFADRACMALAMQQGIPALTGDRDWVKHDVGVAIELFRNREAA